LLGVGVSARSVAVRLGVGTGVGGRVAVGGRVGVPDGGRGRVAVGEALGEGDGVAVPVGNPTVAPAGERGDSGAARREAVGTGVAPSWSRAPPGARVAGDGVAATLPDASAVTGVTASWSGRRAGSRAGHVRARASVTRMAPAANALARVSSCDRRSTSGPNRPPAPDGRLAGARGCVSLDLGGSVTPRSAAASLPAKASANTGSGVIAPAAPNSARATSASPGSTPGGGLPAAPDASQRSRRSNASEAGGGEVIGPAPRRTA